MSETLLGLNAAVTVAFVLIALLAGHQTGSLAFRRTVNGMRAAAKVNLGLLAMLGALSTVKIALTFYIGSSPRIPGWESSMLIVLLTVLPCGLIAALTIPALLKVSNIQAGVPDEPANRTKRRLAAKSSLVVPVQLLAAGSLLFTFKEALPLPSASLPRIAVIVLLFLICAAALTWRQSVRRRWIHRDDGTSVLHRMRRLGVYTTASALLLYGMFYTVASARSSTEPGNRYELKLNMSSGKAIIRIGKSGLHIVKLPPGNRLAKTQAAGELRGK